uniref:Ovule protein n=1 Tax=Brugia timori TaxID=42155 RepID=A0A0R3QSR9_9BILA
LMISVILLSHKSKNRLFFISTINQCHKMILHTSTQACTVKYP